MSRRLAAAWCANAARPVRAVSVLAAVSLVSILLLTAVTRVPEPRFHDESATLVMADVFAHGHLCEPPHSFWQHFETFHLLSQPCYQGKYPPGPALLMALGQVTTGAPIAGVWLSVLLAIAAIAYAMYAWLPPAWALAATTMAVLRFGIVGDWPFSYWGGSLAAAGGALVLGAARHLTSKPRRRDGALLGVGLVALVFSRPYEGAAYSLVPLILVVAALIREWPGRSSLWRRGLPAALAVLAAGGAWLAYYNARVTGSVVTPPYVVYEHMYSAAPLFITQQPRVPAPVLTHAPMRAFERDFAMHDALLARDEWPRRGLAAIGGIVWNMLQPTLMFALAGVLMTASRLRTGVSRASVNVAVLTLATICAACALQLWWAPRYMAPMTASIFLLVGAGLAGLCHWRSGIAGRLIVVLIVTMLMASVGLEARRVILESRTSRGWWTDKRAVRELLLRQPGDDLVFVHYRDTHNPHIEWVYNGALIDQQPVVWAREIDAASDAALRTYFGARQAWVVDADAPGTPLRPWVP